MLTFSHFSCKSTHEWYTTVAHKGHAANKKVAANKKTLLQIKKIVAAN